MGRVTGIPEDCIDTNKLPFLVAMYLDKDKDEDLVEEYMSCLSKLSNENKNKKLVAVGDLVIPVPDSFKPVKKKSFQYLESVFQRAKILDDTENITRNRVKIKKLANSLEKHNDFFSSLTLSYLYIQMNNQSRVDQIIEKLTKGELFELTFRMHVPFNKRKKLEENVITYAGKNKLKNAKQKTFKCLFITPLS
jgi:hypothetical protein